MKDIESQPVLPIKTSEDKADGPSEVLMFLGSFLLAILTFPFSLLFCLKIMNEFERAVIFRLGRLRPGPPKGPGIFFILPCIDTFTKVDLRVITYNVPPQEILTKDSVSVTVHLVVYYRIFDPFRSVIQVKHVGYATRLLGQTTLRNVAGQRMLIELMTEKESISRDISKILDSATVPWGVRVERVEIKNIRLPPGMQRAMAAEQAAHREAKAKVAAADGELLAAAPLAEAAAVIGQSNLAIQLRYMQTLNFMANKNCHTIVMPLPIDAIKRFLRGCQGKMAKQQPLDSALQKLYCDCGPMDEKTTNNKEVAKQ